VRLFISGRRRTNVEQPRGGRLLLIVDDDEQARESLSEQFEATGHRVRVALGRDGIDASIQAHQPDLVVVCLPSSDVRRGLLTGERIRRTAPVPYVFVGGRLPLADRVSCYEAGAEDVIRLPCASEELRARIGVALRRRSRGSVLEFDDIVVDESAHQVVRRGQVVPVTSIEFALLRTFMRHRGQVLSKTQLLSEVWGYEHFDVNLVEVHVSALRRKLESCGPRVLHTVRGAGYVLRAASAPVNAVSRVSA
jgi:DNA-binding response OmpR family regulator